jgi:pimeloyl-ACP methyl ester carboxylesterase
MTLISLLATVAVGFAAPQAAPTEDATFDSNGVKIRYVTAGAGETVVLIHGWMADATMWGRDASGNPRLNADGLPGFRVVALDCRGHGKSDKPYETTKYGAEMAADVVRLLDHLKVKKAHLVGYSMGAFIAGKVAATNPGRVLSVIYGGQAPILAGPEPLRFSEVDAFAKAVDEGKGLGSYLLAVTPPDKLKLTPEQADAFANAMFKGKDVKALAAAGRSFQDLRVTPEELRRCPAPVLFLYGGNESDYVKRCVADAHRALGRGEIKIVEGGDHMTTLAKREFGTSLVQFLQAHKSAGGLP